MPSVQVNGIDLYYEETGSGPPLLLITGLSGNTLGWAVTLPPLAERFRLWRSASASSPSTTVAPAAPPPRPGRTPPARWPKTPPRCWPTSTSSVPTSSDTPWVA
jgi:pimeloyl-ACP methyl ester carboxylesterase